jgi:hypothetical protein
LRGGDDTFGNLRKVEQVGASIVFRPAGQRIAVDLLSAIEQDLASAGITTAPVHRPDQRA